MSAIEIFANSEPLELRAAADSQPATIHGYAAVYNVLSADMGGWRERVLPGAFKTTLTSGADVRGLVDHDRAKILGRLAAKTLTLQDDQRGLRFFASMPNTTYANDLAVSVDRGDIGGASFGFRVIGPNGDRFIMENGIAIRELVAVELIEVSVTSIPAYPQTGVSLRSDPSLIERAKAVITRPEFASRAARFRTLQVRG